MSELRTTQHTLAELLRSATRVSDDADAARFADEVALGNPRLSPVEQLEIYREQFQLRHLDVLREDFGALAHLLGDDGVETLGRAYLQAFPSRSFTLRDLGEHLARFVAETSPWSADALLGDLARVEWAFVDAFDAEDRPALDHATVAALAEDDWPRVRIVLHAHVQRLALGHAAHDYRLAVRRKERPSRPERRACFVVVFRGAGAMQCLELEADAFALLDELARGVPLGEACERVAGARSEADAAAFEENVGTWFQEWTTHGFISRVECVD